MGTAWTVLLLSEATLLALVALVAIVTVPLVVLALAMHRPANPVSPPAPVPMAPTLHMPLPAPAVSRPLVARPLAGGRTLQIDVPTKHVDEFMAALRSSGWRVHETGEVVATDEDEEGLTTILVDVPRVSDKAATGEEIR